MSNKTPRISAVRAKRIVKALRLKQVEIVVLYNKYTGAKSTAGQVNKWLTGKRDITYTFALFLRTSVYVANVKRGRHCKSIIGHL